MDRPVTALPPDVRRGSASPYAALNQKGFALGPGFALKFLGPKAERGAQPHESQTFAARQSHAAHQAAKPLRTDFLCKAIRDALLHNQMGRTGPSPLLLIKSLPIKPVLTPMEIDENFQLPKMLLPYRCLVNLAIRRYETENVCAIVPGPLQKNEAGRLVNATRSQP
jgi:hypothetical protein